MSGQTDYSGAVKSQPDLLKCPCDATAVKALLDAHDQWEATTETRAVESIQSVLNFSPPGQDPLPVITLQDLQCGQELDPPISIIIPFAKLAT